MEKEGVLRITWNNKWDNKNKRYVESLESVVITVLSIPARIRRKIRTT